jgi:hypothetical protein
LAPNDLHERDGRAQDAERSAHRETRAGARQASGLMAEKTVRKHKVEHPAENYAKPADVVRDEEISLDEKKKALDTWEQDARQLVTASNEGMEGEPSGPGKDENHKLDQVVNAKEKVGARPKPKPAH